MAALCRKGSCPTSPTHEQFQQLKGPEGFTLSGPFSFWAQSFQVNREKRMTRTLVGKWSTIAAAAILAVAALGTAAVEATADATSATKERWDASVVVNGVEIPFLFEIEARNGAPPAGPSSTASGDQIDEQPRQGERARVLVRSVHRHARPFGQRRSACGRIPAGTRTVLSVQGRACHRGSQVRRLWRHRSTARG